MSHTLFIHPAFDGHLGWFNFWTLLRNDAMNNQLFFVFLFYVFVIFLNLGVELLGHMGTISFSFKGQVFRDVLR